MIDLLFLQLMTPADADIHTLTHGGVYHILTYPKIKSDIPS